MQVVVRVWGHAQRKREASVRGCGLVVGGCGHAHASCLMRVSVEAGLFKVGVHGWRNAGRSVVAQWRDGWKSGVFRESFLVSTILITGHWTLCGIETHALFTLYLALPFIKRILFFSNGHNL